MPDVRICVNAWMHTGMISASLQGYESMAAVPIFKSPSISAARRHAPVGRWLSAGGGRRLSETRVCLLPRPHVSPTSAPTAAWQLPNAEAYATQRSSDS